MSIRYAMAISSSKGRYSSADGQSTRGRLHAASALLPILPAAKAARSKGERPRAHNIVVAYHALFERVSWSLIRMALGCRRLERGCAGRWRQHHGQVHRPRGVYVTPKRTGAAVRGSATENDRRQ